jgi:hypothetical protein
MVFGCAFVCGVPSSDECFDVGGAWVAVGFDVCAEPVTVCLLVSGGNHAMAQMAMATMSMAANVATMAVHV